MSFLKVCIDIIYLQNNTNLDPRLSSATTEAKERYVEPTSGTLLSLALSPPLAVQVSHCGSFCSTTYWKENSCKCSRWRVPGNPTELKIWLIAFLLQLIHCRLVRWLNTYSLMTGMSFLTDKSSEDLEETSPRPNLFLSYHWDVQNKVQVLVQYLESHGYQCWTDVSNANKRHATGHSSNHENTPNQIQRNIKAAAAVVCCVTPKYICSENCTKDLNLAASMNKPVVPVMLQWLAWPPEGGRVRRILAPLQCIDMSNESLFRRNLSTVENHLKKFAGKQSPSDAHVVEHVRIAKNPRLVQQKPPQKAQVIR